MSLTMAKVIGKDAGLTTVETLEASLAIYCPLRRECDIWAVLAMMVTLPILTYAGQGDSSPIPVVVGTVTAQQVATEVEVVGVEPQLATTLSTEIAGPHTF